MRSIRKSLLQFIFSGASMRRWNDKLRPVELFEIDKQAHKMIVAFLLWQQSTKNMPPDKQRS
ncbi:MAG: phosphohydrolase, partial [Mailhella sp.]